MARATLVGQRFGKQVVLRELGGGFVEVQCDCGTIKPTPKQYLKNGQSRSCGCGRYASRPGTTPMAVGDRFERLVVIQVLGSNGYKREVLCRCDCGTRKVFTEDSLRRDTKSCGCLRRQRMSTLNRTHGQGGPGRTVLYRAWEAMWRRCRNPDRYPSYAPRGIGVCDEWRRFEAFRDYVDASLGARPDGYSLDRIDNDRGYEPGNIRWAPAKRQTRNRSSNVLLRIDGRIQCIADWADESGVPYEVVVRRRKMGWTDHDAVFTPVQK